METGGSSRKSSGPHPAALEKRPAAILEGEACRNKIDRKRGMCVIAQVVAVGIFLVMFALIVMEKFPRHLVTLVCGGLTLVVVFGVCMHSGAAAWEALSLYSIAEPSFWMSHGGGSASTGINWETIFFICGMMIMVEGMADSGFFHWLCMSIARLVHYRTVPIFIAFMLMSAGLSMFIDSITVILFLAAVTVELGQLLRFNPVPMILTEIFCANLGGSATMSGDPPNIIIGTSLGLSFGDFIVNTGVIALVSMIVIVPVFYLCFRKSLAQTDAQQMAEYPDPAAAIVNKRGFAISWIIFLCAVVLLVTHAQTGLTVSCIGVLIAVVTLLAAGKHAPAMLRRVDWSTLLFFIGLFVVISGLEQTGVLELLAGVIGTVSGGNALVMVAIVIWGSAIASAFIDNIPFAATMIPVIRSLAATQGVPLDVPAWTLAMGTDIGGNATPIGASANVVGTAIAAKSGHPISWGTYCKVMAPATVLVVAISMVIIFVRYF